MDKQKNQSIAEIARLCQVSTATVSRAINNQPGLSSELRKRILETVQAHQYKPKAKAASMRYLGVTVDFEHIFTSDYATAIMDSVADTAHDAGYDLVLVRNDNLRRFSGRYTTYLKNGMISGLIMMLTKNDDEFPIRVAQEGFPHILLNTRGPAPVNYIDADNRQGTMSAMQYLFSLGHQKVALIYGDKKFDSHRDRIRGYLDAYQEAGLPLDEEILVELSWGSSYFQVGYNTMKALLARRRDFTALLVDSYVMPGIFDCLRQNEISIPENISVIAYDDPPWMSSINPGICAISQNLSEMGMMAIKELERRIENYQQSRPTPLLQMTLPTQLIIRQSVGRVVKSMPAFVPD